MLDELKEDDIVNRVGGRFKLATLIQKRMIALNQGSRLVVEPRAGDKLSSVIAEIMEEKIHLDLTGNSGSASEAPESGDEGGTVDLTQPE